MYIHVSYLDDLNIARERLMSKEEEMSKTVGEYIVLPWCTTCKMCVIKGHDRDVVLIFMLKRGKILLHVQMYVVAFVDV